MNTLEQKLSSIKAGKYTPADFVIADAKDGDMAFGVTAPGPDGSGRWKPREQHLTAIADMCRSELVDIMLMSASTAEIMTQQGVFTDSPVTPAIRLNDTTDIWSARGSRYRQYPSEPFATTDIDTAASLCNLGLYSMTFFNDVQTDKASLEAYREFRLACRERGMKHFLEVFNPAYDIGVSDRELGYYINDMIIKAIAGVTSKDAPQFLKIQFNGAKAMQELAAYDPARLVVGILGGAAGTTRDTFELLYQAEQAGARVALFGRKINLAEAPVQLLKLMRDVLENNLSPAKAVEEYHAFLNESGITASRVLEDDLAITDPVLMG